MSNRNTEIAARNAARETAITRMVDALEGVRDSLRDNGFTRTTENLSDVLNNFDRVDKPADITHLLDENARLREALRPFAEMWAKHMMSDDCICNVCVDNNCFKAAHDAMEDGK